MIIEGTVVSGWVCDQDLTRFQSLFLTPTTPDKESSGSRPLRVHVDQFSLTQTIRILFQREFFIIDFGAYFWSREGVKQ